MAGWPLHRLPPSLHNRYTGSSRWLPWTNGNGRLHTPATASGTLANAEALAAQLGRKVEIEQVNVKDPASLDALVAKHDLVISLIPYIYHVDVIKSAIKHKKNVVTTSYVSDAMKELEPEVKKAGIVVMNEIGLDPGIDHLYAVKTIDDVHKAGGKVGPSCSLVCPAIA